MHLFSVFLYTMKCFRILSSTRSEVFLTSYLLASVPASLISISEKNFVAIRSDFTIPQGRRGERNGSSKRKE
jgi:hypothetical protein